MAENVQYLNKHDFCLKILVVATLWYIKSSSLPKFYFEIYKFMKKATSTITSTIFFAILLLKLRYKMHSSCFSASIHFMIMQNA